MGDERELMLEDLLHDPVILTLMTRDGFCPDDIRLLARQRVAGAQAFEGTLRAAVRRQRTLFRPTGSLRVVPTMNL